MNDIQLPGLATLSQLKWSKQTCLLTINAAGEVKTHHTSLTDPDTHEKGCLVSVRYNGVLNGYVVFFKKQIIHRVSMDDQIIQTFDMQKHEEAHQLSQELLYGYEAVMDNGFGIAVENNENTCDVGLFRLVYDPVSSHSKVEWKHTEQALVFPEGHCTKGRIELYWFLTNDQYMIHWNEHLYLLDENPERPTVTQLPPWVMNDHEIRGIFSNGTTVWVLAFSNCYAWRPGQTAWTPIVNLMRTVMGINGKSYKERIPCTIQESMMIHNADHQLELALLCISNEK